MSVCVCVCTASLHGGTKHPSLCTSLSLCNPLLPISLLGFCG